MVQTSITTLKALVPLGAALMLAACGGAEEETVYETDATDVSGGEFIVSEEDPNAVPVDTPDVQMTPVAPDAEGPFEPTPMDPAGEDPTVSDQTIGE